MRDAVQPRVYLAMQQELGSVYGFVFEVIADRNADDAIAEVRDQIKAFDSNLPIDSIQTVSQRINRGIGSDIALARLSAFFALLALVLACVGLYGIMSYTVAGRTREIGVRVALGAQSGDVLQLVLGEAMMLVAVGIVVGIPLALSSTRLLRSFLFGLKGTDPLSLLAVIGLLAVLAAVAGFFPARRATKVDPIVALRYE